MFRRLFVIVIYAITTINVITAEDIRPITKEQASNLVLKFYKGLQEATHTDINDRYRHRDESIAPYLISADVFQHPNDWNRIDQDICNFPGTSILINTHIGYLENMGQKYKLKLDYSLCDVSELREVQLEEMTMKEKVVVTYWELTVRKQYSLNNRIYTFVDTVDVKISNGKIALISNEVNYQSQPKPTKDKLKEREAWHNEQITRAARYWSQGRKREAYETYVKSVEDYEDRDIYFRIGILLHNHYKDCTNLNKKQARNLAYTYFNKAWEIGHPDAYRIIQYWWGKRDHAI